MSVQFTNSTPVPPVRIVTQVEVPGQAVVAAMAQLVEYWDGYGPLGSEDAVRRFVTTYIEQVITAKFARLAQDKDWLFQDEKYSLRLARWLDQMAAEMDPDTRREYQAWENTYRELTVAEAPASYNAQRRPPIQAVSIEAREWLGGRYGYVINFYRWTGFDEEGGALDFATRPFFRATPASLARCWRAIQLLAAGRRNSEDAPERDAEFPVYYDAQGNEHAEY